MLSENSINGEIKIIIDKIANASVKIHKIISKIPSGIKENNKTINPSGDFTSNLDLLAQKEIIDKLSLLPQIAAITSEEEENPIILNKNGKYILTIDPLDGSSNIEYNGSTGSIFSIYKRVSNSGEILLNKDFLQKGSQQIIAGYAFYGTALNFVYATNDNVRILQYDFENKIFIKTHDQFKIPKERNEYYCINEAYKDLYNKKIKDILKNLKDKQLSLRYSGALIADIHRILISGGIFLYPSTKLRPEGKLRLIFENNPMAFIIRAAGGLATNGLQNILDIQPKSIHQKTPVFISNTSLKDCLYTNRR